MPNLNKIILGLLLLSSTLFSLDWVKDINTALTVAKKEHKNIMVFVESDYCKWCKKMKHRTLSYAAVEKRLEKFVVVKVTREDGNAMSMLPPVRGVPTIFFMKENKAIIEEVVGYFDVQNFISYLDDVEKKAK